MLYNSRTTGAGMRVQGAVRIYMSHQLAFESDRVSRPKSGSSLSSKWIIQVSQQYLTRRPRSLYIYTSPSYNERACPSA